MSTLRMGRLPLPFPLLRSAILTILSLTIVPATAIPTTVGDASLQLSSESLNLVPACAQDCFFSLVTADFSASGCGLRPSHQCLCFNTGARGFTLGEVAVQCIFAQLTVGGCTAADIGNEGYYGALFMCDKEEGAVTRTNTAINATVVIVDEGTGRVVIETSPATTTSTATTTDSTTDTTMSTVLITPPPSSLTQATEPSSSTSDSSISSDSTTSSSASSSQSGDAEADIDADVVPEGQESKLSTGVIVTIVVVILAVIGLFLCLFLCAKKRRQKVINSVRSSLHLAPNPDDRNNNDRSDSDSYIGFGPPMTQRPNYGNNTIPDRSNRVSPAPRPTMFPAINTPDRTAITPNSIGIAIGPGSSRDRQGPAPPRPRNSQRNRMPPFPVRPRVPVDVLDQPDHTESSPQRSGTVRVPAANRPVLNLEIPGGNQGSSDPNDRGPPVRPKRRTAGSSLLVTPFEEDGEDYPTSATQIWRPPPSAGPDSAPTYYVADKNGNWVLGNASLPARSSQIAELEAPPKSSPYPVITVAGPSRSQPRDDRREEISLRGRTSSGKVSTSEMPYTQFVYGSPSLGGQADGVGLPRNPRPDNQQQDRAQQLQRQASQRQQEYSHRRPAAPEDRSAAPGFSRVSAMSSHAGGSRGNNGSASTTAKANVSDGRHSVVSAQSTTGVETHRTDIAKVDAVDTNTHLKALSPVAESPSPFPPTQAQSPLSATTSGSSDYPSPRARMGHKHPHRRLGHHKPMNLEHPNLQATAFDKLEPKSARPSTEKTTVCFVPTPSTEEVYYMRPGETNPTVAPTRLSLQKAALTPGGLENNQMPLPLRGKPVPGGTALPNINTTVASGSGGSSSWSTVGKRLTPQPTKHVAQFQQRQQFQLNVASPSSATTRGSATSSLLAKRVGNDKAAQLALDQSGNASNWNRTGDPAAGGSFSNLPSGQRELPMSPMWIPKLTPTRRGDDLVLDVQRFD